MLSKAIGVCAADEASIMRAQTIANQLNLECVTDIKQIPIVLVVNSTHAWLRRTTQPIIDWHIDFLSPAYQERQSKRTRKKDALARALGLHKKSDLRILDMSAGLGKDALWLAHCGATVTLLERHPVLAYLLTEAVIALRADPLQGSIGERMSVVSTDALSFLQTIQPGDFDVAYYDPMFQPRRKSALVKKDMQIMQTLLGHEESTDLLIPTLNKISCVVVKRAKADIPYQEDRPHEVIQTNLIRYERYKSTT